MAFNNKVVVIGDMGAGKSALVLRFIRDIFSPVTEATIGAAFFAKKVRPPNSDKEITINVWDSGGAERYRALSPMYLRGSRFIILCVSCEHINLIEKLKQCIDSYNLISWNSDIIICLTKSDLLNKSDFNIPGKIEEIPEPVQKFAKDMDFKCFITSSKTNDGIQDLFNHMAYEIATHTPPPPDDDMRPLNISKIDYIKDECCET